jgi:type I restriction enzyme R subunit
VCSCYFWEKPKSDKAVSDVITYAIREYINENTPKDPELFERLSDKLNKILTENADNWKALREALEKFRQEDIIEGREREETFGYEPNHEMPFFAMLKKELFGTKAYHEMPEKEFNTLKDLTNVILDHFKWDTNIINFWNNETLKNQLRTFIIEQFLDPEIRSIIPNIISRRKDIAQKIMELGFNHFGGTI